MIKTSFIMKKQINQNSSKILSTVKFVGVKFDPDSFKNGENELNKALKLGYTILTDYPTSSGVVFSVGLYSHDSEDVASGTTVYEEEHTATTNDIGLINLAIGGGTVAQGLFSNIDWGNDMDAETRVDPDALRE